jgi:tetratricopeptide (TPR) repeat protein
MSDQNAYSVLGLRKGASEEDIKQAYVELVKKFDPEKHTDKFMVIQAAYESLRDPRKRAKEHFLVLNNIAGRFLFTEDERTEDADETVDQRVQESETQYAAAPTDTEARSRYIKSLMQRSFKKVGKRQWAKAIEDWKRVLECDAAHPRAKNNLVEVLKRWQARLDADSDDLYTRNCIIEVRRHHGGQIGEEGQGPSSIEEFEEILKINPNDFEAQYKIASVLMEQKKWAEASVMLQKIIEQYPRNIEVLNLLGWANINSGHIEDAFRIWNHSLALDPKNYSTREAIIKGRMSMGRVFRNKGMLTQSLVHFKALLRFMPNSAEVHMEIGETYLAKGDKRSAALAFNKVMELDPKNKTARQRLSDMKLRG